MGGYGSLLGRNYWLLSRLLVVTEWLLVVTSGY